MRMQSLFYKNIFNIFYYLRRCYNDALTFADNRTLLRGKCVPAGGHQSLEVLSAQFKMILKEFLLSNDKDIVCTRVNELKVPHFNHDFVYQVIFFNLKIKFFIVF